MVNSHDDWNNLNKKYFSSKDYGRHSENQDFYRWMKLSMNMSNIYYISSFQVGIQQPVIYAGQSIATIYVLPLPTLSSFLEADIFHPNHMNGLSSS